MITRIGKERFFEVEKKEEIKGKLVFHAWFTIILSLGAAFGEEYGKPEYVENKGEEGICPSCSKKYLGLLTKDKYVSYGSINRICGCNQHWIIFTPKNKHEPHATLEIYKITK